MVWIPIPRTLTRAVSGIFRGTPARIAWKLFVLVFGTLILYYTVAVSNSYFVMAVVGIVLSIALSSTIRGAVMDVWRSRWTKV
ncbi:hypothetical protein [Halobaculum magnesiiphilum]|uniref:Uncharacterized protein n=1 Tax=Halobaculum magnesiiphilum TaxID=1017351 RepID=A0A8T8WB73_9EURY|nr:hypothetical protein [Halobaculum magnesiiphilum]QZP37075.1 hypothetical protein K6T50_12355 [Halobaculum magnesiiphilum]